MAATEVEVSPELIAAETGFLDAWPALETRRDGSWVWRYARGFTKRANAIQCQDPRDDSDAAARLERAALWSREAGIPPVFRVTPLAGSGIVAALDDAGWAPVEKSRILYLDDLAPRFDVFHRATLSLRAGPAWVRTQAGLQNYSFDEQRTLIDIIARMPDTATGLTIFAEDGMAAASVLAVLVGDLAMFTNVVTSPAHRRQGLARSAMGAALNAMAEAGARRAAIHVSHGNEPAEALYAGFGFRQIGAYHYRKGPLA